MQGVERGLRVQPGDGSGVLFNALLALPDFDFEAGLRDQKRYTALRNLYGPHRSVRDADAGFFRDAQPLPERGKRSVKQTREKDREQRTGQHREGEFGGQDRFRNVGVRREAGSQKTADEGVRRGSGHAYDRCDEDGNGRADAHGRGEFRTSGQRVRNEAFAGNSVRVEPEWLEDGRNREAARRFLKASIEGIFVFHNRPEIALDVLARWHGIGDRQTAEAVYARVETIPIKPYPCYEGIRKTMELYDSNEMRQYEAEDFYDDSILRELDESGFIDGLYEASNDVDKASTSSSL